MAFNYLANTTPEKQLKQLTLATLLTAGSLLLSSAANASEPSRNKFGDWQQNCKTQSECAISQGLQNPEQPGIVFSSQISYVSDSKEPILQLNLPLGIYLPPGVAIDIGGNQHQAPVMVCLPQGCKVLLVLTPKKQCYL
mgnify:FL=1